MYFYQEKKGIFLKKYHNKDKSNTEKCKMK